MDVEDVHGMVQVEGFVSGVWLEVMCLYVVWKVYVWYARVEQEEARGLG